MRVYLKDGTTFECEDFRAVDAGVLLFGTEDTAEGAETEEDDEDEREDERRANGFIPTGELTAVLSEEYIRQVEGGQQPPQQQPQQGRAPPQQGGQQQYRAGDAPGPDVPPG